MEQRERIIRQWFDMWLQARDSGILDIFAPGCVYTESWGPKYHGAAQVKHWFDEWNTAAACWSGISSSFSIRETRPQSSGISKTGCRTAAQRNRRHFAHPLDSGTVNRLAQGIRLQ